MSKKFPPVGTNLLTQSKHAPVDWIKDLLKNIAI
jgi:hypothetical protein